MRLRSALLTLPVILALSLGLASCGGGNASTETTAEPAADTTADTAADTTEPAVEQQELDADAILDIVDEACPISLGAATDIKVGAVSNGQRTVTFGSTYGNFSYTVDVYTGEIVAKTEPEMTEEQKSDDPIENAIDACFDSLDGYSGGAENIKVSTSMQDGVQVVNVSFDWNGQSYRMTYNTETGEVTQN